jgi:hypothetical protein
VSGIVYLASATGGGQNGIATGEHLAANTLEDPGGSMMKLTTSMLFLLALLVADGRLLATDFSIEDDSPGAIPLRARFPLPINSME